MFDARHQKRYFLSSVIRLYRKLGSDALQTVGELLMPISDEQKIEIWKRAIETQIHFAELSIKMRQIGLTLAGATIALAIVLYRTGSIYSFKVPYFDFLLPVSTILMLSAAAILFAAKMIDVGVYHRMLRGAVKFNELYEESLDGDVGWRSGLTEAITAHSRFKNPILLDERGSNGSHWRKEDRIDLAGDRINLFYWFCIGGLLFVAVALAVLANAG